MADLSNWKPYENRVQGGLRDGNYANGQFILLCAGPPYFKQLNSNNSLDAFSAYPIGLTQNFSHSQNKAVSRIFEIGSDRSYFIPGRTVGQLSLGRVLYHGASLLRVLYATYGNQLTGPGVQIDTLTGGPAIGIPPFGTGPANKQFNPSEIASSAAPLHRTVVAPGYDNMFFNLASDLFNNPMGLLMIMKDSEQNMLSAAYFENCYVPNHSMAVDSQGLIIQESVAIQYERIQPVPISPRVGLIQGVMADEFGMRSPAA